MISVIYLILAIALASCAEPEVFEFEDQTVRPARIFKVQSDLDTVTRRFVGKVDASQTVDMSFEVSGLLTTLPVLEGQPVLKGSVLASLDPTNFELKLREAKVQLELASRDMERKIKLLDDKGISPSQVDDAKALFELRKVNYEQARKAYADTTIHAPFDGFIAKRYKDNHVNVRAGEKILRINDLSELFVYVSAPEKLAATVTPDRLVSLAATFEFAPGKKFPLVFRENLGEADAVAQTYRVTFTMPYPEGQNILPGMTASVEIVIKADDAVTPRITIPINALVTNPDNSFSVWVFDRETLFVSKRGVVVDQLVDGGVQINSGLQSGDYIVAAGASRLQPGMKVSMLGEPLTRLSRSQ